MRDYKFRGKRKDNGEWETGFLYCSKNVCRIITAIAIDKDIDENMWYCEGREVDPETVGQYTGRKDKSENRINIFSGDILHCAGIGNNADEEYLAEVVYEDEQAAFMLDVGCELRSFAEMDGLCELFVVGTIYDNPELIP